MDQRAIIDVVYKSAIENLASEMSALLGQTLTCDDIQLLMTSKADLFSNHCIEESILTHFQVSGDHESLGFMLIQLPDAVTLGGTLIMLPEDQIAEQKKTGQFDGDIAEAYGEIANIISGSLTQVFQDRYPKQLRFIKTKTETVVSTKIDPASDQPFPEGNYYLASFAINLEGHELHRILLIFPGEIFDLENEQTATDAAQSQTTTAATGETSKPEPEEWGGQPTTEATTANTVEAGETKGAAATATQPGVEPAGPPIILMISDQKADADPFVEILSSAGHDCQVLTFQDEVKGLFQQHQILGIFLIMAQVGEKGFAAAIKLQAAGRPLPPIIFAGSKWTRSAVLRAVKYGAKDILILPASGEDIQDKVTRHIKKAS